MYMTLKNRMQTYKIKMERTVDLKSNYLTIDDFNEKGEISNPRPPCVITTIDPSYTKQAALQLRTRKFRVKTDILTLREITRTKFMAYAAKEKILEKQREAAYQDRDFGQIMQLQKFAADVLKTAESSAFSEMKQVQSQLEHLKRNKISDELKKEVAEHQIVLMEVDEVYGRFIFLLKLIRYFDEIIAPEDMASTGEYEGTKMEIIDLKINEQNQIEKKDALHILNYMSETVRPYLAKRNHLTADIWLKGYVYSGQNIFSYNRRFNHLALLNHLVAVIYGKAEKTNTNSIKKGEALTDPQFFQTRMDFLEKRSTCVLDSFKGCLKADYVQIKLNATLPVILRTVETRLLPKNESGADQVSADKVKSKKPSSKIVSNNISASPYTTQKSNLDNVGTLQWHMTCLLQELEKTPINQRTNIEKTVRKRIQSEKEISRRNLIKQNRLENWIGHFKKHALK